MYSFNSRVRYSEVNKDGRLKLVSLLDYFQDCSTFHSEDAGMGTEYPVSYTHLKEYREYYIGKEQEVLFEQCHEIEGRQYLTGHTRNYVRVAVPVEGIDPAEMTNQERICCLTGFADDETLLGTY